MELAGLTAQHAHLVANFDCSGRPRERYIAEVQEMVRDILPDVLRDGGCSAVGAFEASELLGIAAWTPNEQADEWRIIVIAVRTGHMNHGIGTRLKRHILHLAERNGIARVVSFVHRDNLVAQRMNEALGGRHVPDPSDRRNWLICVVDVSAE
jgi:GNAT superfamily N-acetyltransferase